MFSTFITDSRRTQFGTCKLLAAVAASAVLAGSAQAAITGPYAVDSDTLHLWHMDKTSTAPTNTADSVSPGGVNVANQSGAIFGTTSFAGFDRAGNTSSGSNDIIRSSATNLLVAPVGAGGAFTYEAMINISTSSGSQMIFGMDSNGTADTRPFFFRVVNGSVSFQKIAGSETETVAIPTTGEDAFTANEWFHVAVTYNGVDDTADNLKFYWTRVDDSRTEANLIGTGNISDVSTTATAVYGIGNAFRTVGSGVSANLEGSIDEVRISGVARGADEFIFAVPEPSSLALLGLGGLLIARRRRA